MIRDWVSGKVKPKEEQFFELCDLDLGEQIIRGWWTGAGWDGKRYKNQKVIRWRYCGQGLISNE